MKPLETKYEIEYCESIPLTPDGDHDIDRAVYRLVPCASFAKALRKARLIECASEDMFGSPVIRELTRYGPAHWRESRRLVVCDYKLDRKLTLTSKEWERCEP